jgi:catechol 1,2-dioxygenase
MSSSNEIKGTPTQVFGPFFVQKAPFRGALAPINADGVKLVLSGRVYSVDTQSTVAAKIDFWQASGVAVDATTGGRYDYYEPDGKYYEYSPSGESVDKLNDHGAAREYDFRCRVSTDEDGYYEVQTRVPVAYFDPADSTWRCPHIHALVRADGHEPVVTQIYFEGGERNDTDAHRLDELTIKLSDVDNRQYKRGVFNFGLQKQLESTK